MAHSEYRPDFTGGSTVTVTDLASGVVQVNAGTGGNQTAIRPINELTTVIPTTDDFFVFYDNATASHRRVPLSSLLSNSVPIADNEVDTAIRTGLVGTSLLFARADHNHPIRRQVAPAQPVITVGGTGFVLVNTFNNGTVTDEESVTFYLTLQVTQTAVNSWNFFTVPNIAGFQRAEVHPTACYRYTGNPTNDTVLPIDQTMPNPPTMMMEWSYYFNGTAYMNVPNRTQATGYYISFSVRYVRV